MDDDRKKPPRKTGGKPFAGKAREGGRPAGAKPTGGAKKPFRADAGKTPFRKPREASARADAPGEGGAKRPFVKRERPAGSGDERPRFSGGPRPDSKKPYEKRAEGDRKPFVKRDRPAGSGEERPRFSGGPRTDAKKPYEKRAEGDRKPFVKRDRPTGAGDERPRFSGGPRADSKKPYEKRAEGDRKPFVKRDRPSYAGKAADDRKPQPPRDGAGFEPRKRPAPARQETAPGPEIPASAFVDPEAISADASEAAPQREKRPFVKRDSAPAPRASSRDRGPAKPFDAPKRTFRATSEAADAIPGERIAKRLARVGIASRRDAEELIAAGRVKVNGKKLDSPAFNVMVDDVIELDGNLLPAIERTRLFLFHKPAGVVTTNRDPEGRKTVFDVLPQELPRLITIGRLDINTEGLMLLTNDGGLARVLELPATGWLRRYRVRVHGKVDEGQLAGLKDGMAVGGVFYGAVEASLDREQGSNAWLTIGLREGKNREVKNILGSLGLDVTRLIRVSFGPFQLGELAEGHVQELKGKLLRDQLGERLIEESGANFEADILNPFSNEPKRREREKPVEAVVPARPLRDEPPVRIGEGGLIKRRQRREGTRDDALGKLSTQSDRPARPDRGDRPERSERPRSFGDKPAGAKSFGAKPFGAKPFGAKPFGAGKPGRGKKDEREQRPIEPPGMRKANVWMAPGARPIGTGRAASEKAEVDARKAERKSTYAKPSGGKPSFGKPRGDRPAGDRPRSDGPKGPRKGGPGADRRR